MQIFLQELEVNHLEEVIIMIKVNIIWQKGQENFEFFGFDHSR